MNTEEIMKLADAYAAAYMSFSESKARAALEAALSAKQGEQEAVCPLCHGKGEHEMFSAHLPGQPVPERRMVKCNQCANPAPSVNAQERINELKAQNAQLLGALIDIAYGLEGARIWGGMEWTYNPLHPYKYLPLRDKARTAIAAVESNASTHELNSANSLETDK